MDQKTLAAILIGIVYPILVAIAFMTAILLAGYFLGKDKPSKTIEHKIRR